MTGVRRDGYEIRMEHVVPTCGFGEITNQYRISKPS